MPDSLYFASRIAGFIAILFLLSLSLFTKAKIDGRRDKPKTLKWIQNWKVIAIAIITATAALWDLWITYTGVTFLDIGSSLYYIPGGLAIIACFVPMAVLSIVTVSELILRRRLRPILPYLNLTFGALFIVLGIFFATGISVTINRAWSAVYLLAPAYVSSILALFVIAYYGEVLVIKTDVRTPQVRGRQVLSNVASQLPPELAQHYPRASLIGAGGQARVWSAVRTDGQHVALKVFETPSEKVAKLFAKEAANWAVLEHKNIVQLYDWGVYPVAYLALELCDASLEDIRKSPEARERVDPVSAITDVARGLGYAHNKMVIHGDIKPANVLSKENTFKISDWGLSKVKESTSTSVAGITPPYAAPEMLSSEFGKIDERTDIYQLGAMAYELVTGTPPFVGNFSALHDAILHAEPPSPVALNPSAKAVEHVILKCLNKRKEDRYQNTEELIQELELLRPAIVQPSLRERDEASKTLSLPSNRTTITAANGVAKQSKPSRSVLFCANCGQPRGEETKFCSHCGAEFLLQI